jgi:hypothetical protein
MTWRAILLVWLLSIGLGGCFTKRRQFAMPPGLTAAAKPAPQPRSETPPDIQTPLPQIDIPPFVLEIPKPIEAQVPKPVPTRRPTQTPTTPTPTTPGTATEGETQPTTTPTPPVPTAPQLSEILPDDRRKQYEADFAACVLRARAAVSTASNRRLTNHNQETVKRILTFLQQAEDSKVRDLATALQLARRADLLGQDLLKSLR